MLEHVDTVGCLAFCGDNGRHLTVTLSCDDVTMQGRLFLKAMIDSHGTEKPHTVGPFSRPIIVHPEEVVKHPLFLQRCLPIEETGDKRAYLAIVFHSSTVLYCFSIACLALLTIFRTVSDVAPMSSAHIPPKAGRPQSNAEFFSYPFAFMCLFSIYRTQHDSICDTKKTKLL